MKQSMLLLLVGIGLLLIDSALELAWVSDMVYWLHAYLGNQFEVIGPDGTAFSLHGKPANLLVDQGNTTYAAAGTALVVVSLGGLAILFLRHRQQHSFPTATRSAPRGLVKFLYFFWLTFTVLSTLLAFSALIFTMIVTYEHAGQRIDLQLASTLDNRPYPNYVAYPDLAWTPQNWCSALLDIPIVDANARSEIAFQLRLMHGWQWNLVALVNLDIIVCVLAFYDFVIQRREAKHKAEDEMFENVHERFI